MLKYFEEKGEVPSKWDVDYLASKCTGVRRSNGQHPGGIVICPEGHDTSITGDFCKIMVELCKHERTWRIAFDGAKILPLAKDEKERAVIKESIEQLSKDFDAVMASIASARKLIAAYPDTKPAKAMAEMISLFEPELSDNPLQLLKKVADGSLI